MSKRNNRIRQSKTAFRKLFLDSGNAHVIGYGAMIPEFIHIALAFRFFPFEKVREDLIIIADYLDKGEIRFSGVLSQMLDIYFANEENIDFINQTCFFLPLCIILRFYKSILDLEELDDLFPEEIIRIKIAYKDLAFRHNDTTILIKHILTTLNHRRSPDPMGHFAFHSKEYLLNHENTTRINTLWLLYAERIVNYPFCQAIWNYNCQMKYFEFPEDNSEKETLRFIKLNMNEKRDVLSGLFDRIKRIDFFEIYPREHAEVVMGFISRIFRLTFDIVDLAEIHKGEIAESTLRLLYESRVKFLWIMKQNDPDLIERFREYRAGREKYHLQELTRFSEIFGLDSSLEKNYEDYDRVLKEEGQEDFEISVEQGDVYNKNLRQMALEFGTREEILYNALYQRTSDIVHGNWRAIEKYHLAQSQNPIQHGLHSFPKTSNTFAGMVPAFLAVIVCVDTTKLFFKLTKLMEKHTEIYGDLCTFSDTLASDYNKEYSLGD